MNEFLELPDLACAAVGGAAIACNNEFFAEMENLVKPSAPVWKEDEYTDRGKWMDGWETRRYRPADGIAPGRDSEVHDWCIVRLGLPGKIRALVVDTAFFKGNYPETCSISACEIDDPLDLRALETATWTTLLPRTELEGNKQNTFPILNHGRFTHVRLDIYPDGGVARLRVHGEVTPRWDRLRAVGSAIDLAALEHGAVVESCSDMFFGSRNNLIKPGPSLSMADGWETRRRRGPGNDWAIVRLAAPGTIERLELDTSHFKGNAPAHITVEGVYGAASATDKLWRTLLASPVQPHTRHMFDSELRRLGALTHLKLSVFPCGGVARLRAWGALAPAAETAAEQGLARLNAMTHAEAIGALQRCCGSQKWASNVTWWRPFESAEALLRLAERTWWALDEADHREAFAAHPKIGEMDLPGSSGGWSLGEQAAARPDEATLAELAEANRAYEAKHGFIFIVCATGRTAEAMLADLRVRLPRLPAEELRTAAEEQLAITRLRLAKLLGELA